MGGKKGLMTRRFGGRGVARVNITQAINPLTKAGERRRERKREGVSRLCIRIDPIVGREVELA